jgi:hypothetical protein
MDTTDKQQKQIIDSGLLNPDIYKILPYTQQQSKKLGVIIEPSLRKNKKIDVYDKNMRYMVSVGSLGYSDYPTYLELEKLGIYKHGHAKRRQLLYKKRHNQNIGVIGSAGYYANLLLW